MTGEGRNDVNTLHLWSFSNILFIPDSTVEVAWARIMKEETEAQDGRVTFI